MDRGETINLNLSCIILSPSLYPFFKIYLRMMQFFYFDSPWSRNIFIHVLLNFFGKWFKGFFLLIAVCLRLPLLGYVILCFYITIPNTQGFFLISILINTYYCLLPSAPLLQTNIRICTLVSVYRWLKSSTRVNIIHITEQLHKLFMKHRAVT